VTHALADITLLDRLLQVAIVRHVLPDNGQAVEIHHARHVRPTAIRVPTVTIATNAKITSIFSRAIVTQSALVDITLSDHLTQVAIVRHGLLDNGQAVEIHLARCASPVAIRVPTVTIAANAQITSIFSTNTVVQHALMYTTLWDRLIQVAIVRQLVRCILVQAAM
jgi:hypothetical protein